MIYDIIINNEIEKSKLLKELLTSNVSCTLLLCYENYNRFGRFEAEEFLKVMLNYWKDLQ